MSVNHLHFLKRTAAAVGMIMAMAVPTLSATGAETAAGASRTDAVLQVLVYGDSNSFGWVAGPKDNRGRVTVSRLAPGDAWPGQMAERLGSGYRVEVDALGGRTTDLDEPSGSGSGRIPGESFNGLATLPAVLSSNMPLDLVIVMLGSNDLKAAHDRTPYDIALALGRIASVITKARWQSKTAYAAPRVLVVAPPWLDDGRRFYGNAFEGALTKSRALAAVIEPVVKAAGAEFMDAGAVVGVADQADGVHLTEDEHRKLGEAVARKVREMFP